MKAIITTLLEELSVVATLLGGPDDLGELFTDLDDYPDLDERTDVQWAVGYVVGAAGALDVTPRALLEDLGLDLDRARLYEDQIAALEGDTGASEPKMAKERQ